MFSFKFHIKTLFKLADTSAKHLQRTKKELATSFLKAYSKQIRRRPQLKSHFINKKLIKGLFLLCHMACKRVLIFVCPCHYRVTKFRRCKEEGSIFFEIFKNLNFFGENGVLVLFHYKIAFLKIFNMSDNQFFYTRKI